VFFQPIPPYLGFGSPEDSLQSCLTVTIPQPPKKDVEQYLDNVSKVSNMVEVMLTVQRHLCCEEVLYWPKANTDKQK